MKTDETSENDRQEVKAWDVHVVECRSGSYSDSGEPVVLMTLAHQDASCPMAPSSRPMTSTGNGFRQSFCFHGPYLG